MDANSEQEAPAEPKEEVGNLLVLAILSVIVGAVSGLVVAVFRISLEQADHWRNALIAWAQGWNVAGMLLIAGVCASATAIAAWLVRRFSPQATGSGIPHVEAVVRGEVRQVPFRLIPVKFAGGLLAIGSGLALGREGPSVQIGATIAHLVGRLFRRTWQDCRVLLAAGAGAGLATAFNVPIAGAIFVLEEVVRRFETRIAIIALGTSATAISVARFFLGAGTDFHVEELHYVGTGASPLIFLLGLCSGFLAVGYNHGMLGTIAAAKRLTRWPVELRAALVGAGVGMLAWFAPDLVGGGEPLTQTTLAGAWSLSVLPLVFLLRFGLSAVSYAARTPGGLFAPMLVLGAQFGLAFGIVSQRAFPSLDIQPAAFAVVGMAAFFTGVVRAPLTGIVLVTEMTASFTMLQPMLIACFASMLVPALLGNPPIYDSLREKPAPPHSPV